MRGERRTTIFIVVTCLFFKKAKHAYRHNKERLHNDEDPLGKEEGNEDPKPEGKSRNTEYLTKISPTHKHPRKVAADRPVSSICAAASDMTNYGFK